MAKFRIVQREGLFYVQKRVLFLWFYESKFTHLHKKFKFKVDHLGMIGFDNFNECKDYLDTLVNSKTKVVYELRD